MKPTRVIAYCLMVFGVLGVALISVSSAQAQVAISEDGVTFPDNPEPVWGLRQYKIGDRGPANGFVFYVTNDGLHGLEAAPEDQSAAAQWGCYDTNIPGAEGTAIGTGARNTEEITPYGCSTVGIAAAVAAEYVSPSDYFDWYLPSKNELDSMFNKIGQGNTDLDVETNVGGFASDIYWSSSESNVYDAWLQNFYSGFQLANDKFYALRVRAVRAF